MLRSLHVLNFAIIKEISIEFGKGVTVFTGETGSGKSILVDALSILAGKRAKTEWIRDGEDFFCVEGIFSINESLMTLFSDFDINQGEEVIISRKMNRSGKSTCTINGFFCSVKKLEDIGKKLFRFHEQYDNTDLLTADFCRRLVDNLSDEIRFAVNEYDKLYSEWNLTKSKFDDLINKEQEYQRKLDVLMWETRQISDAQIFIEEDKNIEQKLQILQNGERIKNGLQETFSLITAENGVQDKLAISEKNIVNASKYDESLSDILADFESIRFSVEDVVSRIYDYLNSIDFSDAELDALIRRDEILKNLMRKFGPTLEDVIEYYNNSIKEIDEIKSMFFNKDELECKLIEQEKILGEKAEKLFKLREQEGNKFCKLLVEYLSEMSIKAATMQIKMVPSETPTVHAVESMELYFSANKGEPLKPMRLVASGGELSRISLAIEIITSKFWHDCTMIFDEIDMGISGEIALQVAGKLKKLSESSQVVCITHLPQTASIADEHYKISKIVKDGRTLSFLKRLNHQEHLQNIAFMISGTVSSKSALDSAKEIERIVKK